MGNGQDPGKDNCTKVGPTNQLYYKLGQQKDAEGVSNWRSLTEGH